MNDCFPKSALGMINKNRRDFNKIEARLNAEGLSSSAVKEIMEMVVNLANARFNEGKRAIDKGRM